MERTARPQREPRLHWPICSAYVLQLGSLRCELNETVLDCLLGASPCSERRGDHFPLSLETILVGSFLIARAPQSAREARGPGPREGKLAASPTGFAEGRRLRRGLR